MSKTVSLMTAGRSGAKIRVLLCVGASGSRSSQLGKTSRTVCVNGPAENHLH